MCKKIKILILLLFGMIINVPSVYSTTLLPVDLLDLVTESELIFVGTVTKVESRWGVDEKIYTDVIFENLHIIKGIHPDNTLVMELAGGTIGDYHSVVVGIPDFQSSGKHLIFMRGNRKYLCPIVGWSQGKFNIIRDKVSGNEILLDNNNNPITGIQDHTLTRMPHPVEKRGKSFPGISEEHGTPQTKPLQAVDTGKRLSLPEFISIIGKTLEMPVERSAP